MAEDLKALRGPQIEQLKGELDQVRNWIATFLEEKYNEPIDPNTQLQSLLDSLGQHCSLTVHDQRLLADAVATRKILGLEPTAKLESALASLSGSTYAAAHRTDLDVRRLEGEIGDLKTDAKGGKTAVRELSDWETWSRSLYSQISGRAGLSIPIADVRFVLEELLVAGLAHQSYLRKLDTLRSEKRIFLSWPADQKVHQRSSTPLSLRSLLLFVLAARRLHAELHPGDSQS
jgi:hypothetical protein